MNPEEYLPQMPDLNDMSKKQLIEYINKIYRLAGDMYDALVQHLDDEIAKYENQLRYSPEKKLETLKKRKLNIAINFKKRIAKE